jgi:hypothetical protein
MKVTIQAFSGSGGSYPVQFMDDTGSLRVFCHCQAGSLQQICKHKIALLKGDAKMLYDASQEELLKQVHTRLIGAKSFCCLVDFQGFHAAWA